MEAFVIRHIESGEFFKDSSRYYKRNGSATYHTTKILSEAKIYRDARNARNAISNNFRNKDLREKYEVIRIEVNLCQS